MTKRVQIVEVGLRDGLQNEEKSLSVDQRVELARRLADAGAKTLELGAFVRPDRVPQMANSDQVIIKSKEILKRKSGIQISALVPNVRGLELALQTPVGQVAFFTASSESFAKANINCSVEESLLRLEEILKVTRKQKIKVRGYVSTVFGCPYEGDVPLAKSIFLVERLLKMGCYEVSVGDTIGVANPEQVRNFFNRLSKKVSLKKVAGHFHDTRGTALANILMSYQMGVRIFDSSIGGLGGCPYAPGASGNVATEDVVYMFQGMRVDTGLDLKKLIATNHWLSEEMGKELPSKVGKASLPKPRGKLV